MALEPGDASGTSSAPASAPAPSGSTNFSDVPDLSTTAGFAQQVLYQLGFPQTAQNINFLVAWANREGGGGANNPLNTTQRYAGSTSFNKVGVQNYATIQDGITATVQTLNNGYYKDILAALKSGKADVNATYAGLATWSGKGYDSLSGVSFSPMDINSRGSVMARGTGASTGDTQLTEQDFLNGLKDAGFAFGLLNSIPELKKIFDNAIKNKSWQSSTGTQNFISQIESSKWYRSHTQTQRQMADMQYADPAQFARLVSQQQADLRAQALQMGISLKPNDLKALATSAVINGFDSNELTAALAQKFTYNPKQAATGQAGMDVNEIQKLAADYNVSFNANQAQDMTRRLLAGQLNPDTLTNFFKQQALAMHPYLAEQLNAGLTVRDVATPYMQKMADVLEVDPSGVNMNDPTIMKALQTKDAKGNLGLMPMYSFDQMLKQDPRWLNTTNAKNSLMGMTGDLLHSMGLVGVA